jgi:tellurite resistance protein TehA-like permease
MVEFESRWRLHGSPTEGAAERKRNDVWWTRPPPVAGAAVMATGILSVGLELIGLPVASLVTLGLASVLWLVLVADFATRFLTDRPRWIADARTPPSLTAVAATAILGTRLSLLGWQTAAAVLLALGGVALAALLLPVMRHETRRAAGSAFLICVAPQALAVLAMTLALMGEGMWLAALAISLFCIGLVLYMWTLFRFDFREVYSGAGDHWIVTGAVATSALAAAKLTSNPSWTGALHTTLRTATLVLVAVDLAGYAVLLAAELGRPRLDFDIRRWATVFPMGMSAVAILSAATATHVSWLHPVGRGLLWVAIAAWLVTAVQQVIALAAQGDARRN